MSIRTIIEINHDRLLDLLDDAEQGGETWQEILRLLAGAPLRLQLSAGEIIEPVPGVRLLVQRHHSEKLTISTD